MELVVAPAWDAAVEDGTVISWGWLAHHTGATWRRLLDHSAPDLDGLMAALTTVNETIDERYPEMGRMVSEICGTHEGSMWNIVHETP